MYGDRVPCDMTPDSGAYECNDQKGTTRLSNGMQFFAQSGLLARYEAHIAECISVHHNWNCLMDLREGVMLVHRLSLTACTLGIGKVRLNGQANEGVYCELFFMYS